MAEIAPFQAIRYDFDRLRGDLSGVLAPPYDVLDESDKSSLLARSARNIVAIDLPHVPPKSAGPIEAYRGAAEQLSAWLGDGTLIRESPPALYVYHQRFEHEGVFYTRRMFIARARLHPFSDGVILPHEQTFGGPKEDRLALMKATQCQLSPIFGLYHDPEDAVAQALQAAVKPLPQAAGTLDDVENALWVVRDPAIVDQVIRRMADKRIYIADGHHRYGTALLYRDFLAEEAGQPLAEDHPAHHVMFVLANMEDKGCLILPYHRALAEMALGTLEEAWAAGTEPAPPEEADLRVVDGRTGRQATLKFTRRAMLARLEPEKPAAWQQLDAAYLHRYLLDELLKSKIGADPKVVYVKSEEDAKKVARERAGVAVLLKATPIAQLLAVCEAGGLMPQKSTFFYPKLATGLTMYSLRPNGAPAS